MDAGVGEQDAPSIEIDPFAGIVQIRDSPLRVAVRGSCARMLSMGGTSQIVHGLALSALASLFALGSIDVVRGQRLSAETYVSLATDAELRDVAFIDAKVGFAVGDRGVIWMTADGGGSWRIVPSGTAGNLRSICFLDQQFGWIAGGETDPFTHTSSGILLATEDGGRSWRRQERLGLPGIARVRFLNRDVGFVVAQPNSVFPAGVFTTDNGGKAWKPVQGVADRLWRTADFIGQHTGMVGGVGGQAMVIRDRGLVATSMPDLGLRNIQRMSYSHGPEGWMVGTGALVLRTTDAGQSWQLPTAPLPDDAGQHFDWHALFCRGSHCWIAGSPGTRVLHTGDGGASWSWFPTPTTAPIHSLFFLDERIGFAAGSLGTILRTDDGGRTWQVAKSGGARAAMLSIFGHPSELSHETVARMSGQEGYLGVSHFLVRSDVGPEALPCDSLPARIDEAITALGGIGGTTDWRFPVASGGTRARPEEALQFWDRLHERGALVELETQIVRQIRLWRPEVVVTSMPGVDPDRPLAHLVNQVVMKAVELAGDPARYPEQIDRAGLAPWKVKRVYGSLGPNKPGEFSIEGTQIAIRLGQVLSDCGSFGRSLVETELSQPINLWGYQRLSTRQAGDASGDFFAGLVIQPGSDARRALPPATPGNVQWIRELAERRRNLDAILSHLERDTTGGARLIAQTNEMVRDLQPVMAGHVLLQMATQFQKQGRHDLSAEVFELLLSKYPDHPACGKAAEWLVQYFSSGEVAWREQRKQQIQSQFGILPAPVLGNNNTVRAQTTTRTSLDNKFETDRGARAAEAAKWLERQRPAIYYEPRVRFPLAAADRQRGFPKQAEKFYLSFRNGRSEDAWWNCAAGERWLEQPQGVAPKELWMCMAGSEKPVLDGRFDDPIWQHAKSAPLLAPPGEEFDRSAACLVVRDHEFLYFGIACKKVAGREYPLEEGPRPRDPDLKQQDRVELFIDLDRDWVTAYHLVVDSRGWVAEDCWNDASWNPKWFVAARDSEDRWSVECAIPLDELTGNFPQPNHIWAIGLVRNVPGLAPQSWTPGGVGKGMEAGFGYLLFR